MAMSNAGSAQKFLLSQRPMALGCALAVAVGIASTERGAIAHSPDAADGLFRRGRIAMKESRWQDAERLFAESEALDPSVGTRLNLALCEEQAGHMARAWEHLRRCLTELEPADRRRPIAEQHFLLVDRRVAKLDVVAGPEAERPSDVTVDERHLEPAEFGVPLPLDPGLHEIRWSRPNGVLGRGELMVHEGERTTYVLPREDEPTTNSTPEEPKTVSTATFGPQAARSSRESAARSSKPQSGVVESPRSRPLPGSKILGYTLAGIGATAAITSIALTPLILEYKQVVSRHCPNRLCDDEGYRAAENGRALASAATATGITGAVLTGAGLFFLLAWRKENPKTEPTIDVTVDLARRSAGSVQFGGRF